MCNSLPKQVSASLNRSLAPFEIRPILDGVRTTTALFRSAPWLYPRNRVALVPAGAFSPHVNRHSREEVGHVPALRRAGQSYPGHFDRGRSLPHHTTQKRRHRWLCRGADWFRRNPRETDNKPSKGHLAKSGEDLLRHLCEYRVDNVDGLELGGPITVSDFEAGQKVDVSGDTMGRGFAGLQKRHGFTRGPMTHGSKNHRQPGSIGAGTTPGRVYPGKRMSGRYGGKKITTRGLTILRIDSDRNLLVVKGSVPGKPGALLNIKPAVRVGAKPAKGDK